MRKPQPEWMRDLRVGDVLLSATGTERVCRKVTRFKNGDLHCVTFAIKHCSWTKRCYTVLSYIDLNQRGFRPPHHRVRSKMKTPLDSRIAHCIDDHNDRSVDCCDVKGVA